MAEFRTLLGLALKARQELEQGLVSRDLLKRLYVAYNPNVDIDTFVDAAADVFPHLNCGLASVYIRHRLQRGEIINGFYKGQGHTFIVLNGPTIVDITADQYGGPAVYAGPLVLPWSLA